MGLLQSLVYSLFFTTCLFSQPSVQIRLPNDTQCCPAPTSLVSVLNFEYTDDQDIKNYHGLEWRYFTGYKRYPGYPTGWAPIPSNYTTAVANFTGEQPEYVEFGDFFTIGGMLGGIHSLWFTYYETDVKPVPGLESQLLFEGLIDGTPIIGLDVWVAPYEEWHYLCLNFTGDPWINGLRITVPECRKTHGCSYSTLELDDVWAMRRFW